MCGDASWRLDTTDLGIVQDVTTQPLTHDVVESTPRVDDGDHERFTHIVLEGYTPKDGEFVALDNSVVGAMINATPAHYCIALDIAWAYIGLRLVYGALYIGDKPSMRSIVWFLCQISCAALFVVSALH